MPKPRVSGAIDRIGPAALIVRALSALLWVVVATFVVSTLPGVRTSAGFIPLLDGLLKNLGYALAASVAGTRPVLVEASRTAWTLIASALAARALAFFVHWQWLRGVEAAPYPSIADLGWLLSGALLLAGIIVLAQAGPRQGAWSSVLDAVVGSLAAGALAAVLVYDRLVLLATPGTSAAAIVTNLAYPALDVGLLIATTAMLVVFRWRTPRAVWLLLAGVVGVALTDVAFLYLETAGSWRPGTPINAISLAATAMLATAAWVRPRQRGPARSQPPDLVLPAVFALICLGILVYATQTAVPRVAVVLAALGLLGTIVRALLAFRAVRALGQLQRALEQSEVGRYVVDVMGVHRWPRELARLIGLPTEQADPAGSALWHCIPDEDRAAVRVASEQADVSGVLDIVHGLVDTDGQRHVVRRRAQARVDVDGQVVGWEGTVQDITEQYREAAERVELLRRSVASADDERQRLAEHLHDEVVQLLAAALLRVEILEGPSRHLDRITEPISESIRQLRTTIAELAHPTLTPATFGAAVAAYASRLLEPDGVSVQIVSEIDDTIEVPEVVLLTAYRIVQEALSNVRRHAQATRVVVTVHIDEGRLVGVVEDDGIGMPPISLAAPTGPLGHLGLRLMRERAAAAAGAVEFAQASPEGGTEVHWWLPIEASAARSHPAS